MTEIKEYVDYYHHDRTHLSLEKDSPMSRPDDTGQGPVQVIPKVLFMYGEVMPMSKPRL